MYGPFELMKTVFGSMVAAPVVGFFKSKKRYVVASNVCGPCPEGAPGSGFWNLGLGVDFSFFPGRLVVRSLHMPAGLKRVFGLGDLHFLTFSCYRRLPLLKSARARDIFVRELAGVRAEMRFRLIGYVMMPEHVHLLISEPPGKTPSTVLHRLKLRVAKRLRRKRRRPAAEQMELLFLKSVQAPRSFWQARFYDFNVYSEGKKKEKLNYMHANPVKRGLVDHPKDWAWSSWRFYFSEEK